MSFAPYVVLWVALVAASALMVPAMRRPRLGLILSFGLPIAALLVGLLLRPDTELPAWSFGGRQWAITETAYGLTGASLLLLLAGVARCYLIPAPNGKNHWREPALLFALAAASLPALWAADDRTRALGLALFAVVWVASSHFLNGGGATGQSWLSPATRAAGALLCLWAAAALPAWRAPLGLLASAVLLGVWPFAIRSAGAGAGAVDLLGEGIAVAFGAVIATSTLQSVVPSGAVIAAATAAGLLSLVVGLSQAWQPALERVASALRLALGGLALTAAVWVGEETLVPAARLAMFAPTALLVAIALSVRQRVDTAEADPTALSRISPLWLAVAIVLLGVAGLPLTVGFGVLPPLYGSWQQAGGWVLLLLVVVLLSLWLAALIQSGRVMAGGHAADRAAWIRALALAPPLVGLISIRPTMLGITPLVWVFLGAPLVAGVILQRFVPGLDGLGSLLREAAALPQPAVRLAGGVRRVGQMASDALADALAILEGEYGLLWLLGILLLLLWFA
jgi:hypothetical protein